MMYKEDKTLTDCYFCKLEHDMGAAWYVCTLHAETNPYYWQDSYPCTETGACKYYFTKCHARDIVKRAVEELVGEKID